MLVPGSYPGLNPDPEAVRILHCETVEAGVYDDIVWRADNGYSLPLDLDRETGSRFIPSRSEFDRQTGSYSVYGTFALRNVLEEGSADATHPARIDVTDVHWLHAAWRRICRQPEAVVMTVWKVVEEPDDPSAY